jgi:hypothetical protein
MAHLGEQQPGRLALAAGQVLRSSRMVIKAITPKKRVDGLTSGFPNTPLSPGQANFGAIGQTSGLPSVSPAQGLLQQMQAIRKRCSMLTWTSHVNMAFFSHVDMGVNMHVTDVNMHVDILSPAYGHTSNYSQYELSLMINTMQDWTVWRKGLFNGNLATKFYWTRV